MNKKSYDDRVHFVNGNYHSLVKARKPKDIDDKKAYIIGTGLAALSAGGFLVKDAHMNPENITFLEQLELPGGSLDGDYKDEYHGYVARGGREMGHHFEILWDLYSAVPSAEDPDQSILDHFFYTNLDDPNYSKCRIIHKNGQRYDNGKFNLSDKALKEIIDLTITADDQLVNKQIDEVFSEETLKSDFWTLWRSMFAFQNWNSALEMKLYLNRFIHHVGGLPDLSALQFTQYDQYESIVKPIVKWLKDQGAKFEYGVTVKDVDFDITDEKKVATKLVMENSKGEDRSIDLSENDLVFITNGSMTESTSYGDDNTPATLTAELGGSWELWRNIALKSDEFGHPDKFCSDVERTNWESCTVTVHGGEVIDYIEKITQRSPYTGKTVTGGIVTVHDSNWLMSWTINRQPQYVGQPEEDVCVWVYGLFSDKKGNYIDKPMRDCTGKEITKEWLYHIGVPTSEIDRLAKDCSAIPVMMPYITSHFEPRDFGDRPYVVPKGAKNFAFLGQFAETLDRPGRDTVFTTEYSGRTAMEAVYALCGVEKGIPEVYASRYDIRYLMNAISALNDYEKPNLPVPKLVAKGIKDKAKGTDVEIWLEENNLI